MANRFDNVAKALATGMPRRKVLKILVGGAAVAATTTVGNGKSVAHAAPQVNCFDPSINTYVPCVNNPEPIINTPKPERPKPVINIPVPSFSPPGVNQTTPPVIVPPKLDLLPKLVPQINWNFVPFNPTRRRRQ